MPSTSAKKAIISSPDAAPSGRPRTLHSKPVAESRAMAQRQKLDREREKHQEVAERQERLTSSRPPALIAGGQTSTVKRALEGYIQDQIGGNRSKKTVEWHQTALGLFSTYLDKPESQSFLQFAE